MSFKGITFNSQHSYNNLGLTIISKEIGIPKKAKKLIPIPYTNIEYDMSELYGSQTYENRQLTYRFNVYDFGEQDKASMNFVKMNVLNAYMPINELSPLIDDDIPGYYFLAEIRGEPKFSEKHGHGELEITFEAYPFMISDHQEGDDVWDTFNFLADIAQFYSFNVKGYHETEMVNVGASGIMPTIVATSDFQIVLNDQTFKVKKGESRDLDFRFETGINTLKITGTGTVEFIWYKEVL